MKRLVFLQSLIVYCHLSFSMIIRHDINPNLVIVNGNEFQSVFQMTLRDKLGTVQFEGTLIKENWILTCGHFADEGIVPDQSLEILGDFYEIDSVIIHPGYEGWENDIALIRLKRPVLNVEVTPLYNSEIRKGQLIWSIGTGSFGTGDTGISTDDEIKRKVTNRLTQVTDEWLFFKFDSPDSPEVTALEGVSGPGNSGGPALVELDGRYYIVGISSHSETSGENDGTYGIVDIYSNTTSPQTVDWIKQTIDAYEFLVIDKNQRILSLLASFGSSDQSDGDLDSELVDQFKSVAKKLREFRLKTIRKKNTQLISVYANANYNYHLEINLNSNAGVEDFTLIKHKVKSTRTKNSGLPKELTVRTDFWKLPPTYSSLRITDFLTMCLSPSQAAVSYFLEMYYEDIPGNEGETSRFFSSISRSIYEVKKLKALEFKKDRGTVQFYSGDVLWTLIVSVNKTEPFKINGLTISNDK